jgi:hypothetical protein
MKRTPVLALSAAWLLLGVVHATATPQAPDAAAVAFFEKKIRPVFVQHCYGCHSAAAQAKKKLRGGLLLDTWDGLRAGGDSGPAIIPGKAADSLLLKTLRHDGDVKMPPRQKLPDSVISDFEAWINKGAPDPRVAAGPGKQRGLSLAEGRRFWAYRPVSNPPAPTVKDRVWPRDSIDAFVLATLEAKGLRPALEADRRTLVRRLYYDLVGLPPAPEEVDAFVADRCSDAYERLVDRLLASPHFGERWGRHWLDVARFAESLTLRGFVLGEAWRYRDLVIDTFNDDVPFDQFIREQVAGDLLPAASVAQKRRQLVATTFLALGNTNLEEQDKKQLRMDVVDEQLDTIGRTFLAQTLGCARCHDHKFDPIPTRDYYALAGILRSTKTLTHANVSMWLTLPLPVAPEHKKALKAHEFAVAQLQQQVRTLRLALGKAGKTSKPGRPVVRAVGDLPGIVVDDVQAKKVGEWKASMYSGSYVGTGYVHDNNTGKGEKTITFQPKIPRTGKYEVRLAYSPGSNRAAKVPVTVFSADGEKTLHVDQRRAPDIDGLFVSLGRHTFEGSSQGFVLVANEGTTGHVIADAVVFIPVEKLDAGKPGQPTRPEAVRLRQLEEQLACLEKSGPPRDSVISVREEAVIEDAHIHVRGSVHNLGEKVPRGFLQVALRGTAPAMPATASGRRELSDWLASADNPLTARVLANRVWHWLLGSGLVRSTDNFGTTGERPSHPELLDHLAGRFVASGWSVKALVRAIVLSSVYRQAPTSVAHALRSPADPENRLLARANRRRLDAECIRDTILATSGRLTLDRGGPTFRPGVRTDYGYRHTDTRRSVYAPVFRNALPELFEVFDFADPSVTTGTRNVSTAVPQALFLMNHPFVLEQARQAARRLLAEPWRDDGQRLTRAYRLTLGRVPAPGERRLAVAYLAAATTPAEREAAWAQLFQVLFSSVDFRHVN